MVGAVTPLDYERYAVLVSPLQVPGVMPVGGHTEGGGPVPVAKTAATTNNQHGNRDLGGLSNRNDLVSIREHDILLKKSAPVMHPAPETGRGQNLDLFV